MSLVDDQCKEINLHVRHVAQLLVTWFAFFVTGNLIALGWFITAISTRVRIPTPVLWTVVSCFLVVNILGICALHVIGRYFRTENRRLQELLKSIPTVDAMSPLLRISPIPIVLYSRVVALMIVSLIAIVSTWLALALFR